MHGRNHRRPFHPSGGGTGGGFQFPFPPLSQPPVQTPNPNLNLQIPNIYQLLQNSTTFPPLSQNFPNFTPQSPAWAAQENPNFLFQNLGFPMQNSTFSPKEFANSSGHSNSQPQSHELSNSQQNRSGFMEKVEGAVAKARRDIISAGKSVSAWEVWQSALLNLQADWSFFGVQMEDVRSLRWLMATERKINAFIHCFVGVRRMTSLYDLEVAICKNESVDHFKDLELGPLLQHPLVLHYFPSATEATKITSEEMILFLAEFLDAHKKKDIMINEFLDFVAEKKSVTDHKKLGVRIQNLEMYISFIREARMQEGATVRKCLKGLQPKCNLSSSKKRRLDKRFAALSQRVESFSFVHKDFCGKHIRFDSSSSDDEDGNDSTYDDKKNDSSVGSHFKFSRNFSINGSDPVSSCPYPSAIEEMTRLGLKGAVSDHSSPVSGSSKRNEGTASKKKRKYENLNSAICTPSKLPKTDGMKQDALTVENGDLNEVDISLSDDTMKMFISTWKVACRELTVAEVLERMLLFYKLADHKVPAQQRWKKSLRMRFKLSLFPFVGLLNVAVKSIKHGMWDSIYDSFQAINQDELINTVSGCEIIDVESSQKHLPTIAEHALQHSHRVTLEEIIRKMATYFEHDLEIQNARTSKEKNIRLLRKLCNCESWLAEQFCVKEFNSLGYGEFFMFLDKHASLLPTNLQKFLAGETRENFPLEVCMLERILIVLVSQASNMLPDNEVITKQLVSKLLIRQFPSLGFKIMEHGSIENIMEIVGNLKDNVISKNVLFSVTLLRIEDVIFDDANYLLESCGAKTLTGKGARNFKSVTSKDAVEVLLRAPMLYDLNLWSHWDLMFAPSLGPLMGWLLNEANAKELFCLVTRDGKVIRIDPSATVDSFLEAALRGSAYKTAVALLSLFSLSGGENHVPLSLLKCHARQAFEVILNNRMEQMDVSDVSNSFLQRKALCGKITLDKAAADDFNGEFENNFMKMNNAVLVASRFVLDCLFHLPSEFRSFAADVFLSGMRSVIKNAPSAILSECNQPEQRVMIHDIGLLLGIVEWIDDYYAFGSSATTDLYLSLGSNIKDARSDLNTHSSYGQKELDRFSHAEGKPMVSVKILEHNEECTEVCHTLGGAKDVVDGIHNACTGKLSEALEYSNAKLVVESIRRDEFGLDSTLSDIESSMLNKQHARLGRALHCLSQELYSQDSHFLLELVQNADDNIYAENVEPTLTFILQESGIVVLNNERGFSAENIKALCDVGKSTKKGSGGYIGQKGIGFKSVFRVSDAPEIHSNGFHVKFDISEGQIGFVLPTTIPPCNIDSFSRMLSGNNSQLDNECWNTCIVLPFKSRSSEGISMNNINAMFSDLHPSLLLFLHRLQRIIFRNMVDDSLVVMRREIVGNGIIKVLCGEDNMTWLVESQKLHTDKIRPDVQTTEIAIAFTLQESDEGNYKPHLGQQPVFAYLPLRTYGLKFILQGDFVLPSSREEIDADSPWNQWLLLKFPDLFVSAEKSFCTLPCFRENPGKAVGAYMSFVPLVGEVHGFFSCLPRIIISKLRISNCLLTEGDNKQWVPPCKVLRGWNEQARALLPDWLLHEHLGLGFLDKDVVLSDSLSRALGIQDYGPKILVEIMSSLSQTENGLKSMGLGWLSSWLSELYTLFGQTSVYLRSETDLIDSLRNIPFIPLSDGTHSSLNEGTVWLHSDGTEFNRGHGLEIFPALYAKLRIINPALLSSSMVDDTCGDVNVVGNLKRMLCRIGVQQLSAHEIIKVHILPAISDIRIKNIEKSLMVDYLCFVMIHLCSSCLDCHIERENIISELRNQAFILTNHGFKRLNEVSIHFGEEFGNSVNVNKLINDLDMKWHLVDLTYLKHPASKSHACGPKKWREFFQEIGVTDFVQVVQVDKSIAHMSSIIKDVNGETNLSPLASIARDWESHELAHLLSLLSKSSSRDNCKYLLEVLDKLWDDCFSDKTTAYCNFMSTGDGRVFKSSFIRSLCDIQWVVSSMDDKLHYPKDLFYDCDEVRSILGTAAPYAVPKVRSEKLLRDIGFKTKVTLDDVLEMLQIWRKSGSPFKASIAQMTRFYRFIWSEMSTSKQKITEKFLSAASIFVPCESAAQHEDVVSGVFLSLGEVCWHDSTGTMEQMKEIHSYGSPASESICSKTLCNVYPGLHDFFINECGILEMPSFRGYSHILLQLSRHALPSSAASSVFQVFLKWADAMKSVQYSEDVLYLKECLKKLEFTVLPTEEDKWVSLHHSFGLVCWSDDEKLKKRFRHKDNIDFLKFGKISDEEQEMLRTKVATLMHALEIPALSEVVTREAIYKGLTDSRFKLSLINWALPYAQRYIYSIHRDKYFQLKESGFDNLNHLQILVVKKLYCRYVIKRCGTASKKRIECNCLLQGNSLYTTPESDSHSLFMELSSLLFNGTPDLHLANFLHMITTMAESGSNEEQTDSFILNSQKIQKLPDKESIWSLSSASSLIKNDTSIVMDEQDTSDSKKKGGTNSNWPPVDWKTAPGFNYARANGFRTQSAIAEPCNSSEKEKGVDSRCLDAQTTVVPIEINSNLVTGDDSGMLSTALNVPASEDGGNKFGHACCQTYPSVNIAVNPVNLDFVSVGSDFGALDFSMRDQLNTGAPNAVQALQTGRQGEKVAFKYFTDQFAHGAVKWVNEYNETGLPYDIIVGKGDSKQYIEVKATKSVRKDWFNISVREWQFAAEKGEAFTIAHVLLGNKEAMLTLHRNPVKLCQEGKLRLVVMMPRQQQEIPIIM